MKMKRLSLLYRIDKQYIYSFQKKIEWSYLSAAMYL